MPVRNTIFSFLISLCIPVVCFSQHEMHHVSSSQTISNVEPQPLLAQALRLREALNYLGSALSKEDQIKLQQLRDKPLTEKTSKAIQAILDPYCLALVDINPESRVKVQQGAAAAHLIQNGWTSFLVKVHNEAGITAQLQVESPNSEPDFHISTFQQKAMQKNLLSQGQIENRFLQVMMYSNRPLLPNLSGLALEYAVVQIYSKDAGNREAELGFNVGQGTQDIGFRNTIDILFHIARSVKVIMNVKDDDGSPAMASFIITDGIQRTSDSLQNVDYRITKPQLEYHEPWVSIRNYKVPKRLTGIYPLPSRRVAAYDEYPDFFFQPQVYRSNGEYVLLPPGKYDVTFTRGPEYIRQTKEILVPDADSISFTFQLKRWVNMEKLGWYSADHHIHAAGCSHYESPEEGVLPKDMWRQIVGEDLNVGSVLSWGPGWYYQKQYFTGQINPLSNNENIMRYDVEVSGFPSSHAGHLVLLNLKEDDYPNTTKIEDWPSWTLPVLKWAKSQGGITGYAHSGWGLQPVDEPDYSQPSSNRNYKLLNYTIPKMDDIGANEYIVTITQNVIDLYSAGDTPAPWELNMWYHTLNCGFRPRLSGETDFPCIYDERVGVGRSYFKADSTLSYAAYIDAIKAGRSYVSDGSSHIINFSVNGLEVGTRNSELDINAVEHVKITAQVAAYLSAHQDAEGANIAHRNLDRQPYWSIERARIGTTRNVNVELIVNGEPVDTTQIVADGSWQNVSFEYNIKKSCWVALRIFPSSHTNPIFIIKDGKPVRELKSAEWCRKAVDQCWHMKENNIRASERSDALAAYDAARKVYDGIIREASQ